MPQVPPVWQFWAEFYRHPAAVNQGPPTDYSAQTALLQTACADLLAHAKDSPEVSSVVQASADFALESPLTPKENLANDTWLGDVFDPSVIAVCRCRDYDPNKCRKIASDWLEGPNCGGKNGALVVESIYSFVHVGLSRTVSTFDEFLARVGPLFRTQQLPFRPLAGTVSVALVTASKWEEKHIHKLLRAKEIKLDMGVRIFRVTTQLVPDKPGDVV